MLVVLLYCLAFPYHPALRSPNELSRLMQTRALVDFGEASVNRAMRVYGPVGDLSVFQGRYYPSKAPLLSYAAVPIYATLRALVGGRLVPEIPLVFTARLFLTVLPTLLSLVLLRRFLGTYITARTSNALVVFYALGTLAFSYSLLFMSHQTTAAFLFAGFFLAWRWSRSEISDIALPAAGALAALAVTAEYTSALCAGLLAVYALLSARVRQSSAVRAVGLFALGAIPFLTLLLFYHAACFGGPLETGYRHLADVAYQPWHVGGFLGIRTPDTRALFLSLFSPLRGLLALAPGLSLGFIGLRYVWTRRHDNPELRPIAIFTAMLVVGYLYFTASFSYESWGWTTGPRHLTGLVPFLLLPAGLFIETNSTLVRGFAIGLLVASVAVTGLLTLVNYIPDDVSDGMFGLAVPLFNSGYIIPSLLNFVGWPNPWPGFMLMTLLCLSGAWVGWLLLPSRQRTLSLLVASLTVVGVLIVHRLAYRDTPQDRAALTLLRQVWLAPPGRDVVFWSSNGRRPRDG